MHFLVQLSMYIDKEQLSSKHRPNYRIHVQIRKDPFQSTERRPALKATRQYSMIENLFAEFLTPYSVYQEEFINNDFCSPYPGDVLWAQKGTR